MYCMSSFVLTVLLPHWSPAFFEKAAVRLEGRDSSTQSTPGASQGVSPRRSPYSSLITDRSDGSVQFDYIYFWTDGSQGTS